jgi:hypothetical protein
MTMMHKFCLRRRLVLAASASASENWYPPKARSTSVKQMGVPLDGNKFASSTLAPLTAKETRNRQDRFQHRPGQRSGGNAKTTRELKKRVVQLRRVPDGDVCVRSIKSGDEAGVAGTPDHQGNANRWSFL